MGSRSEESRRESLSFSLSSLQNSFMARTTEAACPLKRQIALHFGRECVHNMAKVAKEATTFRRVFESILKYLDNSNSWPSQNQDSGWRSTHQMIAMLIKHLEHKALLRQPERQLSIVQVTAALAEQSKAKASVQTITAITDLVRRLKKSLHVALDSKLLAEQNVKFRCPKRQLMWLQC